MEPHDYPRRVLLAVTGMSPQVVTESIYALAIQNQPAFVPTEVYLITTQEGAERARLSLLHDQTGWFHRLVKSYDLKGIQFDASHIYVLKDGFNRSLSDIRTHADNMAAADSIVQVVRELTNDEDAALHVSIAGGRKTMGFYLGYAISLLGRPQDRLSHVLVSAPYESHKDFYFPTKESNIIYTPAPDNRPYDTRDAEVTLSDIPFVRLRDGLDERLFDGRIGFGKLVEQAQKALPYVSLEFVPEERTIIAGGKSIRFTPVRFALYWLYALLAKNGYGGIHWTEDLEKPWLELYGLLVGTDSPEYENAVATWGTALSKDHFDPHKSHINNVLKRELGKQAARPYLVVQTGLIPGTRYRRFGLKLKPEDITVPDIKLTCLKGHTAG